jgi:hypothetical protein
VPSSRILRVFLGLVVLAALAGLFWWRRDTLTTIGSAFRAVRWEWVAVAIALNLLSVIARAFAWTLVIRSAMEPPRPRVPLVFSAFSVGLFANAVLPGPDRRAGAGRRSDAEDARRRGRGRRSSGRFSRTGSSTSCRCSC